MPQPKGVAIGIIAAGSVLTYAGLKGYSIPQTIQNIIQGKTPANQAQVASIGTPVASTTGVPGNLGTGTGAAIASDALRYKGSGYMWGGAPANGPGQHDCSSLANEVVGMDEGLAIPGFAPGAYKGTEHGPNTIAWLAWTGCTTIGHTGTMAQAGDLAVWQTHMGICLGPNQMISAQSPANGTQVSKIDGFIPEILFIRRLKAVK
jgi:cell wall-associated NlpC family hydrolase